ncbi:MAG: hypothetical protein F6K65_39215 [Moorea sp. SIO3C2]|nr:hypothetical protein [Moorena sp. SIO3C2]
MRYEQKYLIINQINRKIPLTSIPPNRDSRFPIPDSRFPIPPLCSTSY